MVEGRQINEWNHTAQMLAMFANAFRNPRSRPFSPLDFHPFYRRETPTITLAELAAKAGFTTEKREVSDG